MKIEKIAENKIRILLNSEDIREKNIDLHTLMTKALESQSFFLDILNKAEAEFGFNTEGYRLLIEAYASQDDDFIFTITKYAERKKAVPRKVRVNERIKDFIYSFNNFDEFCELCTYINCSNMNVKGIAKSISLHKYNEIYYLIIKDFDNMENKNWISALSEFGRAQNFSQAFESKLREHGTLIIKHNALNKGVKFFA